MDFLPHASIPHIPNSFNFVATLRSKVPSFPHFTEAETEEWQG